MDLGGLKVQKEETRSRSGSYGNLHIQRKSSGGARGMSRPDTTWASELEGGKKGGFRSFGKQCNWDPRQNLYLWGGGRE